ncbi:sodium:solute symporter family protein [Puniceicoccaceae bacterium K14]|nr:sodium:solute symporter family protein [Puniceicoccaceae bacterium K14]
MFGLSVLDIIVVIAYFLVIVWVGVRASLKIKGEADYFLGGRKFGKLTSTFASFGQATSADGPAGVATTTFNNGASGVWSALLMLFVTPLFWITSPWLRRLRIITMGDFFRERYGSKRMAGVYALIAAVGMMGLLSVGYMAVSKTAIAMTAKSEAELTHQEASELAQFKELQALQSLNFDELDAEQKEKLELLRSEAPRGLHSHLNEQIVIWSICILVILYTALGGLEAAFYTDMLQGVFIILLSVLLIPFAWMEVNTVYGGEGAMNALRHIHSKLPESFFEIFGSPLVLDFTWYYIATVALVSGLSVVVQPNQLVTAGAAKDEWTARVGFVSGTFMKRIVTILWGVFALAAALLYKDSLSNPDYVWGHATKDLLGGFQLGLVGLMIASMMAALMSTADCLMITVSGLFVRCIYTPLFPNKSESQRVWVGRISGGVFLIGAALVTTQFDNILQVLKFVWEFFVIFAATFWLGLKWRRANRIGAWWSIGTTFALFYFIPVLLPLVNDDMRANSYLAKQTTSQTIERVYTAKEHDVADGLGSRVDLNEEAVKVGDKIVKTYALPSRSIFWSKGIQYTEDGAPYGRGYLYLEMLLLDFIGVDLESNPYALNETIRLLVRLFTPFLILVFVSLISLRDNEKMLDCFFTKMRTPVVGSENEGVVASGGTQVSLLFPNSDWEIYKWRKVDAVGVLAACGMIFVIIGFFYLMINLGR